MKAFQQPHQTPAVRWNPEAWVTPECNGNQRRQAVNNVSYSLKIILYGILRDLNDTPQNSSFQNEATHVKDDKLLHEFEPQALQCYKSIS